MNAHRISLFGLSALCALVLCSCETSGTAAFPTAQALAAVGDTASKADIEMLAHGRKIFTTACTECHVARPIAGLSVPQWRRTLAIMAPRAHLSESDRAAVEAYVTAARASLPGG